ncbi:MAG: hypothetical protein R2784_10505 [Saprospiraceae bacterium]
MKDLVTSKGNTFFQLSNGSQTSGTTTVSVASGEFSDLELFLTMMEASKANITGLSRTNHNGAFFLGDFDPVRWEKFQLHFLQENLLL